MVSDMCYPSASNFSDHSVGVSFLFSATAFVLALFIRQRHLDGPRA